MNMGILDLIKKKRTPNKDRPKGARNYHLRAEAKRRREEGEVRNKKWAALTPHQQLKRLDDREMVATKQRTKILQRLESNDVAKSSSKSDRVSGANQ